MTSVSATAVGALQVVNNYDWYKGVTFLGFLRDVGKYARMGTMLNKDSVRTRLASEAGMSFTEFTYQLLQGYDFVHLCKEEGVRVQVRPPLLPLGACLRLILLCTCPPLCAGVLWPMPAWV